MPMLAAVVAAKLIAFAAPLYAQWTGTPLGRAQARLVATSLVLQVCGCALTAATTALWRRLF